MMTRLRCAALALSMTAMLGGSAQATLLWYDGFSLSGDGGDYVVDAPLHGTSGGNDAGSGTPFFSGNWVADNPGDAASLWLAKSTGLTRPGLTVPTVGGSASNDVDFFCCVFGRTGREFESRWGGFTNPDGTFYMGFLVDFGTGNALEPSHRTIEFHDGGFDDNLNLTLELGIRGFASGPEIEVIVRDSLTNPSGNIGTAGGGAQAILAENANLANLAYQGTHYMVLKFEMSTTVDDVISVFLDPVGDVEPTPSASVSVGEFLADRITLGEFMFNSGDASAAMRFDELRVGTEFADVGVNTLAYVPEPGALSLVGIGAMGLLLVGRRK